MADTNQTNLDQDLADLGGDARAAAENPMRADPGVRDASATGGGAGPGQGAEMGGVAAGGLSSGAAGGAMGDSRMGQDPALVSSADAPASGVTLDQGPNADDLGDRADRLEQRVREDTTQASELGRLGPGGQGVGNTIAPQTRTPASQD